MNQHNRTLGHAIRADNQDPMKTAIIDSNLQIPGAFIRRVGRPRYGWVKENCPWIYEKHTHESYDPKNQEHDNLVKQLAIE